MTDPKTDVAQATAAVAAGDLIVIPTDTVYGVAAALDADAVHKVFTAKGRPEFKPLPVLAASSDDLAQVARFDDRARALAAKHWPGPLTLVLPRAAGFDVFLGEGGEETVAVRVPDHETARAVLADTGPLAVTSANHSGGSPAHTIEAAREILGDSIAVYVDAGDCSGVPSTIVSLVGESHVIRPGGLHIDL